MSWAPTSRRGLPLNCRLFVKGIQKASRLLGEASKFATSTVEVMMGVRSSERVAGGYNIGRRADKPPPALALCSAGNWPGDENEGRSPCPMENAASGSAVPPRRRAARGLRREGEIDGRTPCPAVEGFTTETTEEE